MFLAAASQRTQAHPARARHRADAAAVQPSGARRRAHRDARPRVERPRRLRHRRVVVGGRARRVHDRPDREARDVGGGPARRGAVHDRDAVHRPLGQVRHDAAAQRRARSRARSRTRRCGSRAAGATRSTSRPRRRSARSRSRSSTPRRRSTGSTTTTRRSAREGVPIGDAVNAEPRVRHHVHVPRGRGRSARAAGSKARTSSATRSRTTTCSAGTSPARPTCGPSTRQRRAEHGYDPEAVQAAADERGPARRQGRRAGHRRPARRGRHARPGPRVPPPLRGVRRRPGDLLLPGGQEPPRAHHGEPRAVRPRGAARVHGARREARSATRRSGSRR